MYYIITAIVVFIGMFAGYSASLSMDKHLVDNPDEE